MSTWTFSPDLILAALTGAALFLSVSLGQAAAFHGDGPALSGQTALPVLGESVVISAPRGYCIDPLASLSAGSAAFVLLGTCQAITGNSRATLPAVHGLLTASVDGKTGSLPSPQALASFFASAAGRAALSRSGDPAAMEIGELYSTGDVLYLHASEAAGDPAMAGHSWRAVFEVNDRMVTATLRDFAGHPIAPADGFRMVEQFVQGIVAASVPHPAPR